MALSTKDAWLKGPGDLKEVSVDDVPVKGSSVKIRALSATINNQIQTDAITTTMHGRDQLMRVDAVMLDVLKFQHGVVEPQFNVGEARSVSDRYGEAFNKVITAINKISGITEEDQKAAEARFPGVDAGASSPSRENGADDSKSAARSPRPDVAA